MLMSTRNRSKQRAALWAAGMVIAAAVGFSLPLPQATPDGATVAPGGTVVAAH
jgi:hypothetical protein